MSMEEAITISNAIYDVIREIRDANEKLGELVAILKQREESKDASTTNQT